MDFVDIRLIGEDALSSQSRGSRPVRVLFGRKSACYLLIGQQPDQSSGRSPGCYCDGDVDKSDLLWRMSAQILPLVFKDYLFHGAKVENDVSTNAIHAVLI